MTQYHLHLKGYVGGADFNTESVLATLAANPDAEVSVLVDSTGGQLATALSISSAFHRHGKVHVHFTGMNASAATISSLGAQRISMDASALYLVHKCSMAVFEWASMNADQLQEYIDGLSEQKTQMDKDLIEGIKATLYEIWHTKERIREMRKKKEKIPAYLKGYIRKLDTQLNKMRSVAVYYKEYSSIENIELLGENYIRQMKRDLTPLTFQTSILCQRIGIRKDGFYSSMKESHKYNASNFEYLDSLGYEFDDAALDCRADKDLNLQAPICIGMDYNANINWIVAGQPKGHRLNVLKSFFVKFEQKLPALIAEFCNYYAYHENKTVVFYYDATALGSNYAVNDQDFHYVIVTEFERHGWEVVDVYLGNPMKHDEKYLLINQAFAGKQRLMPFFNRQNNDDLILAIQTAQVYRGRLGFRKNKNDEKRSTLVA